MGSIRVSAEESGNVNDFKPPEEDDDEPDDDYDLCTVWSAPNYCYRCGNMASILMVDSNNGQTFELFREVEASAKATPPRGLVPYFL